MNHANYIPSVDIVTPEDSTLLLNNSALKLVTQYRIDIADDELQL